VLMRKPRQRIGEASKQDDDAREARGRTPSPVSPHAAGYGVCHVAVKLVVALVDQQNYHMILLRIKDASR
jgi:hypothetical protein